MVERSLFVNVIEEQVPQHIGLPRFFEGSGRGFVFSFHGGRRRKWNSCRTFRHFGYHRTTPLTHSTFFFESVQPLC